MKSWRGSLPDFYCFASPNPQPPFYPRRTVKTVIKEPHGGVNNRRLGKILLSYFFSNFKAKTHFRAV
jgi:hypothetical protein